MKSKMSRSSWLGLELDFRVRGRLRVRVRVGLRLRLRLGLGFGFGLDVDVLLEVGAALGLRGEGDALLCEETEADLRCALAVRLADVCARRLGLA